MAFCRPRRIATLLNCWRGRGAGRVRHATSRVESIPTHVDICTVDRAAVFRPVLCRPQDISRNDEAVLREQPRHQFPHHRSPGRSPLGSAAAGISQQQRGAIVASVRAAISWVGERHQSMGRSMGCILPPPHTPSPHPTHHPTPPTTPPHPTPHTHLIRSSLAPGRYHQSVSVVVLRPMLVRHCPRKVPASTPAFSSPSRAAPTCGGRGVHRTFSRYSLTEARCKLRNIAGS